MRRLPLAATCLRRIPLAGTVGLTLLAIGSPAFAATNFTVADGFYNTAANWDNGLPTSSNPGTIGMATRCNNSGAINWSGATLDLGAGGSIRAASSANSAFNAQNTILNMTGGTVNARYILANGTGTTFRISGGLLSTDTGGGVTWTSATIGATNGAKFYISGSASLKSTAPQHDNASGILDFASNWTGSWVATTYTAGSWKAQFTNTADTSRMTYNGVLINDATFDSVFQVSADGTTLSLTSISPKLDVAATTNLANNGSPATLQIPISNASGDGITALNLGTVTASGPMASAVSNITAPATIAAGQTASINFDFNPSAGTGSYVFNLSVPSDDASAASPRTILVNIQVTANPQLVVNTSYTFTNNGAAYTYSVPVSNTSPDGVTNLGISGVTVSGTDAPAISNVAFPATVAPGSSGDIIFDFDPDLGAGTYTFNLEIASNDKIKPSPRIVPVTITVTDPAIQVSTTTLNLGTLAPGAGPQEIVIPITNGGGTLDLVIDQELTAITGNPAFTITSMPGPIAPGSDSNLVITFNPGASDGKFTGTLTIRSNDSAGRQPAIALSAFVSPSTPPVALDFGTATSAVADGYTRFTVAQGATQSINGVTFELTSTNGTIAGGSGASGDLVMTDYAATPFNGSSNAYISVKLTGLKTGTLKFLSSHNYNNSLSLPLDVLFGEAGATLTQIANDIGRPSTAFHTATVEAGKTYEIRVLEQGNANVAYISGLMLWGDAVPEATGYTTWAAGLGLSGDPDADFDKDGIPDAVEFLTGSDPKSATSSAPMTAMVSGGSVTFTFHRADASEVPGTTATVRIGTTLDGWPTVLQVGANSATSDPNVTVAENASDPDLITVTVPTAGVARQFARLVVEVDAE